MATESRRQGEPRTSSVRSVLREVIRRHRWRVVLIVSGALLAGIAESAILAMVASTATAMVAGDDRVSVVVGPLEVDAAIATLLVVSAVAGAVRLALQTLLAYLPARVGADTQATMRLRLFDAYSRSSWSVQADERDGHLQELLTNQAAQATQASLQATMLLSAGLTFFTLVVTAFLLGPITAILVMTVAAALGVLLRPVARRGREYAGRLSASQIEYAGAVGTAVRLAEEIYTFGTADAERDRLAGHVERARRNFLMKEFAGRLTHGLYQGLVVLMLVGGLAGLYLSGTTRIASLGAVVLILVRAAAYGQQVQVAWQVVQHNGPFLDRLAEAEARYGADLPTSGDRPFPVGGSIRLDGVSFAYRAGVDVLSGLDLHVEAGETVGIVGPSGAGKSTLVQVLLRLRVPTSGSFRVGEVDVDDIDLEDWRRHVSYVPQEPRLIHATVRDNIRFDRAISDEAVEEAARMARIHDVIVAMPAGYDTVIGQRADAVSGGQRQRICLARALAGGPAVLVLDEPTSALDSVSEEEIRVTLDRLRGGPTILVVTHRPTLLEACGRVVHVVDGRANEVDHSIGGAG